VLQVSEERELAKTSDMDQAFDAALGQVRRSLNRGMTTKGGTPADAELRKLQRELEMQHAHATKHGVVDRVWFQETLRWIDEWLPESEIMLIAVLGRIARAAAPPV
jgi:hypothetical protein